MGDDYRIHLNFLPVAGDLPDFQIQRRQHAKAQEDRPNGDDVHLYSLPVSPADTENRSSYWIALDPLDGFEGFVVKPSFNNVLTTWILFKALVQHCKRTLKEEDYWVPARGFLREIHFPIQQHKEGVEQLIIQPYHMRSTNKFGLLADFHFRKSDDVKFSRRVQQLSLSLDERFRRNLDFYVDRIEKITEFLKLRRDVLTAVKLPGSQFTIGFRQEFEDVPATRLRPRSYVFKGEREARSQFTGLKDYGPLRPLSKAPKLIFMFREQDRQAARTLAAALRGNNQRERFSFPGFEHLFKTPIEIDSNPAVLKDFSADSMEGALSRIKSEESLNVPVLVMPDDDVDGYLNHKAVFVKAGIASQVCTL